MSPVYLNPQHSSSIPFLELKGDHNQQHNSPSIMGYVHDYVTNTNNHSYFSGSNLDNHHASNTQFLAMDYSRCSQEKVVEKMILSHEKPIVYPFDHQDHKIEIIKRDEKPKKCKPTKLRIMQRSTTKKIIGDNHKVEHDHNHNHNLVVQPQQSNMYRKTTSNDGIRMCTDCHTTTTPLWRSGPHGPKSLCNACGIRQRKARRAAMAAAAAVSSAEFAKDGAQTSSMSSTTTILDEPPNIVIEDMRSEIKLPLKKRSKTFNATWSYNHNNNNNNNNNNNHTNVKNNNDRNIFDNNNNYHNEDFALNSRNKICTKVNSSQRVFPRDEEEGAILLMALSCGLACSS